MNKGFTLIEIVIATAILSIIVAFSAPSFNYFLQKQQVTADVITITSLINSSKIKAIQLKQKVSLCGINESFQCQRNWQDLRVSIEGENTALYKTRLSANYKHTNWSSFQRKSSLTFNPRGYTNHLNGSLYLCHATHPSLNRVLRVAKSGRITTSSEAEHLQDRCN